MKQFNDIILGYFEQRQSLYRYLYLYKKSDLKNRDELSKFFLNSAFIYSITQYEKTLNSFIEIFLSSNKFKQRRQDLMSLYDSYITNLDENEKIEYILFKNKPITMLQYFKLIDSDFQKIKLDKKTHRLNFDFTSIHDSYESKIFSLEREITERRNTFVHRGELADKHYISRCGFDKLRNQKLIEFMPEDNMLAKITYTDSSINMEKILNASLAITDSYFNYSLLIMSHTLIMTLIKNKILDRKHIEYFLQLLLEEFTYQFLIIKDINRARKQLKILTSYTSELLKYYLGLQIKTMSEDLIYIVSSSMKSLNFKKEEINRYHISVETHLKKTTYGKLIFYIITKHELWPNQLREYLNEDRPRIDRIYDNIIFESVHSLKEFKDIFKKSFKKRYDMNQHKIYKQKKIFSL